MDAALQASYAECKRLNSLHGKTYYLATLLLPARKRPYVHALYGFARYADEIVDDLASTLSPQEKADALRTWSKGVLANLQAGTSSDHIGRALVDTVQKFQIPHQHFVDFLHSMEMDLTVTEYNTYQDLHEYVYGSAAVIGLEMVLGIEFFKSDGNPNSGSVVPIAFPLIAGSGTLTTIMSLKADYQDINILIAILINLVVIYAVLKSLKWIENVLGPSGLLVVRKFFGVILLAIAIKIFGINIQNFGK